MTCAEYNDGYNCSMAYLTSGEVEELFGISHRNLDYWVATGVVEPTVNAEGRGTRRLWDTPAMVHLGLVARLRELGVTLKVCRDLRSELELWTLYTMASRYDAVLIVSGGRLSGVIRGVEKGARLDVAPVEGDGGFGQWVGDSDVLRVSEIVDHVRAVDVEQLSMDLSEAELSESMTAQVEEAVRLLEETGSREE